MRIAHRLADVQRLTNLQYDCNVQESTGVSGIVNGARCAPYDCRFFRVLNMIRDGVYAGFARAEAQAKTLGKPKTATDAQRAIREALA